MINKDFGWVSSMNGEKKEYIKVKMDSGSIADILIGIGVMFVGILMISRRSFYRGANAYCKAEKDALTKIDAI